MHYSHPGLRLAVVLNWQFALSTPLQQHGFSDFHIYRWLEFFLSTGIDKYCNSNSSSHPCIPFCAKPSLEEPSGQQQPVSAMFLMSVTSYPLIISGRHSFHDSTVSPLTSLDSLHIVNFFSIIVSGFQLFQPPV